MRSTENAWKPEILSCFKKMKMPPTLRKSTDHDQNLTNKTNSQDTSACQIVDHFAAVLSRKNLETPYLAHFTKLLLAV